MPVYFLRAGDTELVKIGWAENVATRVSGLQTAHYEELVLLRTVYGARGIERWFHNHFAAQRRRGEWFSFVPEMLVVTPPKLTLRPPPIPPDNIDPILSKIEAFIAVAGMHATVFGREVANDPHLVHDLRKGREPRRAITQKIHAFIAAQAEIERAP